MGKLFTVIYTSTSVGFCKTRINQLACEESIEKLEIIFTFRFTVLFYTTGSQSVVQEPVEGPKALHGAHKVLPFSITYLCKGIFSLYALYKYLETDCMYTCRCKNLSVFKPGHSHSFNKF